MQLNAQQEEVADHVLGRILTLAGPGSGKTKTLTERTGRLIRKGVPAYNILCLTFTNKARDEMRDRIVAVQGAMAAKVFISNFHGLCGIILRRMAGAIGYTERMTICDSDDQIDLLLQLARMQGMEPTKPQARGMASAINDWRENLGTDAQLIALIDDKISEPEFRVIRKYVEVLRARNQCDFSGLLSESVRLLRNCPEVREKLQKKFRFIQVDEFQDTNKAQNEIVELLAGAEDNVLAVGDGDQSIYEWRGASPDGIPQFIRNGEAKTGHCKIIKLGVNYRSTPEVIAVADRLIKCSTNRIPVEFSTVHKSGEPVKCAKMPKPEDEAEVVAMNIEAMMRGGTQPRDMAVFYRTNDMSRLIEQALAKRQIAYVVVGSGSYYDRMEVKDVLSMLRFLCNPRDGISFARIANKPARGMGDALIGKLEAYVERRHVDLLHALETFAVPLAACPPVFDADALAGKPPVGREAEVESLTESARKACRDATEIFGFDTSAMSAGQVVTEILRRTKYDEWLKDKYEEKGEYEARNRNVNELVNSIINFSTEHPRSSIADYLQSISLYTDHDGQKNDNGVRLMSLHASKGLEFDIVYMIGVEQGILPHEKAIKDRAERGLEEERRLCYVGFTRARKVLRVTWCQQRQDTFARSAAAKFKPSVPSRFLMEAGLMSAEEYQEAVREAMKGRAGKKGR